MFSKSQILIRSFSKFKRPPPVYAKSKLNGEKNIINNFSKSTILRPSLVYSVDDNFTTNMMSLLSILPCFPLYYKGKTKFIVYLCKWATIWKDGYHTVD